MFWTRCYGFFFSFRSPWTHVAGLLFSLCAYNIIINGQISMLSLATIIFCSDLDNYVPIWFVFSFFGRLKTFYCQFCAMFFLPERQRPRLNMFSTCLCDKRRQGNYIPYMTAKQKKSQCSTSTTGFLNISIKKKIWSLKICLCNKLNFLNKRNEFCDLKTYQFLSLATSLQFK